MKVLLLAVGFACVFESLMPLIAPRLWQDTLRRISGLGEDEVRRMAFVVAIAGLALIWMVTLFW